MPVRIFQDKVKHVPVAAAAASVVTSVSGIDRLKWWQGKSERRPISLDGSIPETPTF